MSFTVVPLHNLSLGKGARVPFGEGLVLQDVPEWLRNEPILNEISYTDRQLTLAAEHALVAEYEAAAIGQPDPDWQGKEPKSIQEVKAERAILANLALWLMHPTTICFSNVFHAISWAVPGEVEKQPWVQQIVPHNRLLCHPKDVNNVIQPNQIIKAARIHQVLCSIPRGNPVWEALRASWAALTLNSADLRYACFWMGLEALFGAEDGTEVTYKLSQRIALFLADSPQVARDLFRKAKTCYRTRSKIIHGRWEHDPKIDGVMADTESIVRTVLRHLADYPDLLTTFMSRGRDKFLEDFVFSHAASVLPKRAPPAAS